MPPDNTTEQEKVNKIKEWMVLTDEYNLTEKTLAQIIALMKSHLPQVPPQVWDNFRAELNANELNSKLIPSYSKYLTIEDVEGPIKFYETPVGRKFTAVYPEITRELRKFAQRSNLALGMLVR